MGCQRPGICATTQESHFPHLPPCVSQPKHTSGPHWAGTGHAGTAREMWLHQSKSPKWYWGQEGFLSHPCPTHAMMPERWKSSAERYAM